MRIICVIQARMSSTRLPGKISEVLGDKTVLGWVVGAARGAQLVDEVVVATSDDPSDDLTEAICQDIGVQCVRGDMHDVISRFMQVLSHRHADAVVRLTADCPLIDPRLVDACVEAWLREPKVDLVTNGLAPSYPRGMDVEVISRSTLDWLDSSAEGHHRTHVTSALTESRSTDRRILSVSSNDDNSDLRLTVDTREDLDLVRAVVEALGNEAQDHQRVFDFLRSRPDLIAINRHVRQKRVEDG